MDERKTKLTSLFFTCAKIGVMTFGGGLAMFPMFKRELVETRNWITEEELVDMYAVGQCTPGIIAVNVSTYIGYKRRGVVGGIVSTLGMITPSILIIVLLASLISKVRDTVLFEKAFKGIRIGVCAGIVKTLYKMIKNTVNNWYKVVYSLVVLGIMVFLKVSSVYIVLLSLIIGILLYFVNKREEK